MAAYRETVSWNHYQFVCDLCGAECDVYSGKPADDPVAKAYEFEDESDMLCDGLPHSWVLVEGLDDV